MTKIPIIKLKKFFPSFVASREAAKFITQRLMKQLSKTGAKEASLDFQDVIFISRSFADEILDSIEKLHQRKIRIKYSK